MSWERIIDGLRRRKTTEAEHIRLGRWGERHAYKALKRAGIKPLGKNVRVGKHDEIDLLARDGSVLIIVEVKTRRREGLYSPKDAVNKDKQRKLSRAAVRYAKRLDPPPEALRFDIIEVLGCPEAGKPVVRHHPAAFPLSFPYRW